MVIPSTSSRVLANTGCYLEVIRWTAVAIPVPHPTWFCCELFGPSLGPKQNLSEAKFASEDRKGCCQDDADVPTVVKVSYNLLTVHLTKSICSHINPLHIDLYFLFYYTVSATMFHVNINQQEDREENMKINVRR